MFLNRIKKSEIDTLPDGTHADGGNLYLRKSGQARSWVFRYRYHYTTHELGLGSAWVVSITEARSKAAELRLEIAKGNHPTYQARNRRRLKKETARAERASVLTIGTIVEAALTHKAGIKGLRTPRYVKSRVNAVLKHTPKHILSKYLCDVTKKDIAETVTPFVGRSTAGMLLSALRACFAYAKAVEGYKGSDPTAWQDGLNMLLPAINRDQVLAHRASVPWQQVPEVYRTFCSLKQSPVTRLIRCLMLSGARLSEYRRLKPADVDFAKQTVHFAVTKTAMNVIAPMTRQLAECLSEDMGEQWVFEGLDKSKCVGTGQPSRRLKEVTGMHVTLHGFRASFSTWCADNGKDPTIRELCLGHTVDNKVALAYQRSDLLDQRRALLQEWNDYVTSLVDPQ